MADATCSVVEGGTHCPRPTIARGWCNKHYVRWQRTGSPLTVRTRTGTFTTCAVVENGQVCGKRSVSKGLCRKHYSRFQRHGNPLITTRRSFTYTDDPEVDFWSLVDASGGPDSCWLWQGTVSVHGYGMWHHSPAHRYSYRGAHGDVPDGTVIDHTCHVPSSCPGGSTCLHRRCVNPAHLKAVLHAQNVSAVRSSNGRPLDDRCSVEGCDAPYVARRLCSGHYQRLLRLGTTLPDRPLGERPAWECAVEGCGAPAKKRGWCDAHWKRWYRTGDPTKTRKPGKAKQADACSVEGCAKPVHGREMCSGHYQRLRKHGDPLSGVPLRRR